LAQETREGMTALSRHEPSLIDPTGCQSLVGKPAVDWRVFSLRVMRSIARRCRSGRRPPGAGRPEAEPQAPLCGGLPADLNSSTCASGTVRALRFGLRPTGGTEAAYRNGPARAMLRIARYRRQRKTPEIAASKVCSWAGFCSSWALPMQATSCFSALSLPCAV